MNAPIFHTPSPRYSEAFDWIVSESPDATESTRDETLRQIAAHLRGQFGVLPAEAVGLMSTWGQMAECEPPPQPAEIALIVKQAFSGLDYEQNSIPHSPPAPHESPIANRPVHAATKPKTKKEWALSHARADLRVFPLKPYVPIADMKKAVDRAKEPLLRDNWREIATTDLSLIEKWWTDNPDANIGIATDGFLVLDIDPDKGGTESFAALCAEHDVPETLRSKTQSGGHHHIYRQPNGGQIGNSKASDRPIFGSGIDVRACGGYIVAPGSTIAGRQYQWDNDWPIAPAPQWMMDRCKTYKPKNKKTDEQAIEDTETAVEAAKHYIEHVAPEAVEGDGGDLTTFKVACAIKDCRVSKRTALELMREWNLTNAIPPWEDSDLRKKVDSAYKNGRRDPNDNAGLDAIEIDESKKPAAVMREPQVADNDKKDNKFDLDTFFPPLDPFEPATLPPIPWVIRKFLARGTVVQLAGPGGISKSSLNMLFAVAAVTGRQDLCPYPLPKDPKRAMVVNAEDSLHDMKLLLGAIMQTYGISHEDLGGRLRLLSLLDLAVQRKKPVPLVVRDGRGGFVGSKDLESLIQAATKFKADIVVLDPLVALHPAQESSNEEMRAVMQTLIRLPVEANCACLLSHHFRKADKSADRSGGDASDARGASAIADACRGTLTLVEMSETDAAKLRLAEGTTRHDYVRLDDGRISRAKRRITPLWFRRESVEIGGDPDKNMPVLRLVPLEPDARPSLIHLLAKRIAALAWADTRVRAKAVIEAMPEAEQLWFGKNPSNWAREIKKDFAGAQEAMTDFGILSWSCATERAALTLVLKSASSAYGADADGEIDEKSEP